MSKFIHQQQNKINDLEVQIDQLRQQLAETEQKLLDWQENSIKNEQTLTIELAEKDKEIERLKNLFELNNEVVINQGKEIFDLRVQVLQQKQNQTQLALQKLEKVKEYCDKQFFSWENTNFNETYDNKDVSHAYYDVGFVIQQQINALEGEKDERI